MAGAPPGKARGRFKVWTNTFPSVSYLSLLRNRHFPWLLFSPFEELEEQAMGWTLVLVPGLGAVDLGCPVSACLPPPLPHSDIWEGGQVSYWIFVHTCLSGPSVGSLPLKHLYFSFFNFKRSIFRSGHSAPGSGYRIWGAAPLCTGGSPGPELPCLGSNNDAMKHLYHGGA